ncbi:MAG: tRNA lysidine(34) synthetase TilS [Clostridia bacterium]|nr:tRNA lysidine(34) synthetase TilS [Clostridia bacterium]
MPERLLVGFSGGADSTALMCLLLGARGTKGLYAVHVNHGLRGAEADADEAFAADFCLERGIPLMIERLTPGGNPGEGWARQARWESFRRAMEACGAEALVLAHHRDDQAETLLLHLMRGAGLPGLCGMPEDAVIMGMRVLRPLLGCTHRELCDELTSRGQTWREDASNSEDRYLRNRVRHELLPLMEALQPGAVDKIAETAALLRTDEELLEAETQELLKEASCGNALLLRPVLNAPEALRRRAVRGWWQRLGGERLDERALSRKQTEAALRLLCGGRAGDSLNLPGGVRLYRGWHALHLVSGKAEQPHCAVPLTETGGELFGITLTLSPADDSDQGALPSACVSRCVLRSRQPGDWVRTGDGRHHRSLQDELVDRHMDAPWRDILPLLCMDSEVLAIPGLYDRGLKTLCAEGPRLSLRWEGKLPWTLDR